MYILKISYSIRAYSSLQFEVCIQNLASNVLGFYAKIGLSSKGYQMPAKIISRFLALDQ